MAKKIIVAGAGHGGLIAAAMLAIKGYNVTILERGKKGSVGNDWPVSLDVSSLEELNLTLPQSIRLVNSHYMTLINPRKTVQITPHVDNPERFRIEGREFREFLINNAAKHGAKIVYDVNILGPETLGNRVVGVFAFKDGRKVSYSADLVIDAAGCESPVRSNLPAEIGIEREFAYGQKLYVYRALYERKGKMLPANPYCIYLYHMNCKGIDSLLTEDEFVDVTIGRYVPAKLREISAMLSEFKIKNPHLGKNTIRGGVHTILPIRRALPVFVADGYAAVGDSAGMTNPVFGWGINYAMQAGKILAKTILGANHGNFSVKELWDYQRNYFLEIGSSLGALDKLQQLYFDAEARDIDYLFEKKIITTYEFESFDQKEFTHFSVIKLLGKAIACTRLRLRKKIIKAFRGIKKLEAVSNQIPERYDLKKVKKWAKKYENI
ncbi:MAG: NAD(P)/FAD-dependent oxidoreductase [Clostridiales bacterium]|nr:NAD(P)/FAD-dependent oxidoreductase [Clostridiales bacterium]